MSQLILTILEDSLLSIFVSNYTQLHNNKAFIYITTFLLVVETTIIQYVPQLSVTLPIIMIITLLLIIRFYKKHITLNDAIGTLLGTTLILLTDIISLLLLSFSMTLSLDTITTNTHYVLTASILAKIILAFSYFIILHLNLRNRKKLNYKEWWILLPIWSIIFMTLYILGESIMLNKVTLKTTYIVTMSIICLSSCFLILFYKIQKENELKHKNELLKQKEFYIKKNYEMIKKLHDEIKEIEHSTIYNLLYIKGLLYNKKYNEIDLFLQKSIYKSKKFKNVINSGNPYFDHELNKSINNLISQNANVKKSIQMSNKNFEIDKLQLDVINATINLIFDNSDKSNTFNLEIIQKDKYIIITIIYISLHNESSNYKNLLEIYDSIKNLSYSYKEIEKYSVFKILIETEIV